MSTKKYILLGIVVSFVFFSTQVSAETFSRNLRVGDVGVDVMQLQKLLNENVMTRIAESGPGSLGNETTYFGDKTERSVALFQGLHAEKILVPAGLSVGTGFFGSLTRAVANTLTSSDSGDSGVVNTETTENVVVRPKIDSITPKIGGVGTKVTIKGSGFLPTGNTVGSALEEWRGIPSSDGTTLEITINGPFPAKFLEEHKDFYKENKYTMEYQITVTNTLGRANFMPFTFTFF